jgi:hypothetical protein
MEQTSFELTTQQKILLATLAQRTGKPVPALLDEALATLQERVSSVQTPSDVQGHEATGSEAAPQETPQPIWDIFEEASRDIPEEELARLPTDLAAQVDHYIYGVPKR